MFDNDYSLYTAKQWGISPDEIDISIFKRVPIRFSYDEGYFDDKYQFMPKYGYTEFFKNLLNHKNIEIQTDFSSNDTVFNADLIITDWSGIAYEYAFTTLRPVLYINTPMKIMNPEYEKIGVVPINIFMRDSIGCSLNLDQLDRVADEATRLIEQRDLYHDKIDAFVKQYVYHLGTSAKVGANYIKLRLKQIHSED